MKRRAPIGSRKWREVSDFDLKVLSSIIIILSLATVTLVIYAFYLKIQKSQVDVVIREITPEQSTVVQKTMKSATETVIIMQQTEEKIPTEPIESTPETQKTLQESHEIKPKTPGSTLSSETDSAKPLLLTQTEKTQNVQNEPTTTQIEQTKPENLKEESKEEPKEEPKKEENKYLKELTKFDYNLLVSRMAENLPPSAKSSIYLYTVDGENALKIAKSTQNYIIDQIGGGKYLVLTLSNVTPELNPSGSVYTVMTEPVKESKEAFKSVVNFRTLGISSFSISTSNGYVICLGLFTSESKAKNFYYSQDWVELTKYGHTKGAKVAKIGN